MISPFVRVLERKDIIKLRRERIPGREEGLVGRFVRKILFDYRFFEEEFSKSLEMMDI